jgi:exopolysaccharide production protein ExoZ
MVKYEITKLLPFKCYEQKTIAEYKMKGKNGKIDSIQALRAVAVILVIYAHAIDSANENLGKSYQTQFFYLEDWGAIGLDLFFIISGFIIATVLPAYAKRKAWKDFFVKRFTRIIPLYWLLSIVAAFTITKASPSIKAASLKTIFFFPIFDVKEFYFPLISVGWSLSYEVYFYVLAGLLLIAGSKRLNAGNVTIIVLLSLVGYLVNPTNVFIKFITSPLLLEFAIGVTAAVIYKQATEFIDKRWLKPAAIIIAITGAALMVATIFTGYKNLSEAAIVINFNHPALYRSLIWGVPCGMLVFGLTLAEKTFALAIPKLLIRVGDASYSAYLIQGFVIYYFTLLYKLAVNSNPDLYIVVCTVVCTIVSIPIHLYIEKMLIKRTNQLLRR